MWMNSMDIEDAVANLGKDLVLGPAARYLRAFQEEVDRVSDGWPYWTPASHAAGKLMALLHAHMYAGMGAYPRLPPATRGDVEKAMRPIRAFLTRRGKAAGMTIDGTVYR